MFLEFCFKEISNSRYIVKKILIYFYFLVQRHTQDFTKINAVFFALYAHKTGRKMEKF